MFLDFLSIIHQASRDWVEYLDGKKDYQPPLQYAYSKSFRSIACLLAIFIAPPIFMQMSYVNMLPGLCPLTTSVAPMKADLMVFTAQHVLPPLMAFKPVRSRFFSKIHNGTTSYFGNLIVHIIFGLYDVLAKD